MNLLAAITSGRPIRRKGWGIWVFLTRNGTWCAVGEARVPGASLDPEGWPPNPGALKRDDYLARDWELL